MSGRDIGPSEPRFIRVTILKNTSTVEEHIMQTPEELSKEIAEFCRESANQKPKRRITQSGIGKIVLQGIMVALLAIAAPTGPGNTPDRSGPWAS